MRDIGIVLSHQDSPSTQKFYMIVNDLNIKKGMYVLAKPSNVLGFISEIFRSNRYFENFESISSVDDVDAIIKNFPVDKWDVTVAEVNIVGKIVDNRLDRHAFPPKPGSKVYIADDSVLFNFFGFDENGLDLGLVKHHSLHAKFNLSRLLQKHLAILAMSGAGKSNAATVLMEELIKRKKEQGRIAIVVIDIHGEYAPMADVFTNVRVFNAKNLCMSLKRFDIHDVKELFDITDVQEAYLKRALDGIKSIRGASLNDLKSALDSMDIKQSTMNALERVISKIEENKIVCSADNPSIKSIVKPGQLVIFDFSSILDNEARHFKAYYILKTMFALRRNGEIPPYVVFVEEAHNLAPEQAKSKKAPAKRQIELIAREGRKFGASLVLITQRPSHLSQTALSQCNTHMLLRMTNPNDLQYINSSVESVSSSIVKMIPGLNVGEAIVVGEASNAPVFIQIREKDERIKGKSTNLEAIAKEWEENSIVSKADSSALESYV